MTHRYGSCRHPDRSRAEMWRRQARKTSSGPLTRRGAWTGHDKPNRQSSEGQQRSYMCLNLTFWARRISIHKALLRPGGRNNRRTRALALRCSLGVFDLRQSPVNRIKGDSKWRVYAAIQPHALFKEGFPFDGPIDRDWATSCIHDIQADALEMDLFWVRLVPSDRVRTSAASQGDCLGYG